jgi:hypothetical protein
VDAPRESEDDARMLEAVRMAGWSGFLLVALGFFGALASLACVAVAITKRDGRVSAWMALVAMLFATASFGIGIIGMRLGRHQVDRALAAVSIVPSQVETILFEGYAETRYCVRIGLVAGALPFLLGLAAMAIGLTQPKRGAVATALVATLFAALCAAADVAALAQPLPGRDWMHAEGGARDLYDAHALLARGDEDLGCGKLAQSVEERREFRGAVESGTQRTAPLPDLGAIEKLAPDFLDLTRRCGERLAKGIERDRDPSLNTKRLADFRALEPAIDLDARQKLRARIDAALGGAR